MPALPVLNRPREGGSSERKAPRFRPPAWLDELLFKLEELAERVLPAALSPTALATRLFGAVAALGVVTTLVFGGLWWSATQGSDLAVARAREDALAAAQKISVDLQTLSSEKADRGLARWQAVATGPLLDEFTKNRDKYVAEIVAAKMDVSARVVNAGLSDLDAEQGTAKAILALNVMSTPIVNGELGMPDTKWVRMQLGLVRTDAGWKATSAGSVPQ